jgi:hypothetical protein
VVGAEHLRGGPHEPAGEDRKPAFNLHEPDGKKIAR